MLSSRSVQPHDRSPLSSENCTSRRSTTFKSTDGGESWSAVSAGFRADGVRTLAIDPKSSSTVYAGTVAAGVLKSTDGGANWSAVNTGMRLTIVRALAIDPQAPGALYAGTLSSGGARGDVFKSTDGAGSWSWRDRTWPLLALAVDPQTPATVYAGTEEGGVLKSTDGGESWSPSGLAGFLRFVGALAIDPQTPATRAPSLFSVVPPAAFTRPPTAGEVGAPPG